MKDANKKNQILESNKLCHPDCTKYDVLCPRLERASDIPTKFTSLGFHALYTFFSWSLLYASAHSGLGYFAAQSMMCAALVKYYFEFVPADKLRKYLRWVSISIAMLNLIIALLGLLGIIFVFYIDDIAYIKLAQSALLKVEASLELGYVWFFCALTVICTFLEWVVNITPEEKIVSSKDISG